MDECKMIKEMLLDYVNRNLPKEANSKVIIHLSQCKDCLKELAEIIAVRDMLNSQLEEVPEKIRSSAYEKIRKNETGLSEILNSRSPFMALELVRYSLAPVKATIKLATQSL